MLYKLAIATLLSVCSLLAQAQAWPSKPIRLVVNFAAGSAPDVGGRAVAKFLAEALEQPVVVENRVGAAGNAGIDYVVRAQPDGYTLIYSPGSSITMNPHLYKFDKAKDLVPIAAFSSSVLPLVVRPGLPIQNVKELIAYGRANPGKLNFGSSGVGSPLHIASELFVRGAGISAVHVPYPGSAQTVNALLAGDVDFAFDAGVATPHVKAGKLKYIAVSDRRSETYPGLPTVLEEAGFPVDAAAPGGIFAPPGTPAEIVNRVNLEIGKIAQLDKFKAALSTINSGPLPKFLSPQEFARELQAATERYGKVIRAAGIKSE